MRIATQLGISHKRAFGGWTPTRTTAQGTDGSWVTTESREWDAIEIRLVEALHVIDEQTCQGCGGDLTVELTDKPPHEDDGDGHFHRWHHLWCRKCVSRARLEQQLKASDEKLADTGMYPYPQARYLVAERLPIPTPAPDSK